MNNPGSGISQGANRLGSALIEIIQQRRAAEEQAAQQQRWQTEDKRWNQQYQANEAWRAAQLKQNEPRPFDPGADPVVGRERIMRDEGLGSYAPPQAYDPNSDPAVQRERTFRTEGLGSYVPDEQPVGSNRFDSAMPMFGSRMAQEETGSRVPASETYADPNINALRQANDAFREGRLSGPQHREEISAPRARLRGPSRTLGLGGGQLSAQDSAGNGVDLLNTARQNGRITDQDYNDAMEDLRRGTLTREDIIQWLTGR